MSRKISAIAIIGFALLVVLGTVHRAMAQAAATPSPATPYSKMLRSTSTLWPTEPRKSHWRAVQRRSPFLATPR